MEPTPFYHVLGTGHMKLWAWLRTLGKDQQGQDLAEYCLITALVVLVAAGIFVQASGGIQAIWSGTNTQLVTANSNAGSQTGSAATASAPSH